VFNLIAGMIKAPLLSVNDENKTATIKVAKVDVGVSGYLVHKIVENHSSILWNVTVVAYDKESKIATLKLSNFDALKNNALPKGKWKAVVGDKVELAFGYTRALLIAPSEEIYHQITKSVNIQWIHPDIFATILSYRGHPTPLKKDFTAMSVATSVGLLFVYLDKKLYTVDIRSFKILNISEAPLVQDTVQLPFYSRVEHIEANWWGAGSDELKDYETYYYGLLTEFNNENTKLYKNIELSNEKNHYLLDKFVIEESK
jgi:hypothetical protein